MTDKVARHLKQREVAVSEGLANDSDMDTLGRRVHSNMNGVTVESGCRWGGSLQ